MENNNSSRKKIFIITGAILIALIVVVLLLIFRSPKEKEEPATFEVTSFESTTPIETETATIKYAEPKIDFKALQSVNSDCYAYLEIPDTPVSYPVLRSSTQDDDYYLNVTFEGASGYPGSVYTQQITSPDFSDYISVLYGHDMADESYFGSFKNYIDKDYFKKHSKIFIYTPEKQFEYKLIAQVTFSDDNISYLYDIKKTGSAEEFFKDLANGESENVFDESYKYKKGDKYIVLATCIGWRPENRRLLIGVLTEELPVRES